MTKPKQKIKKMTMREELEALRAEVADIAENQKALDLAFRSLELRNEALETLLRHMQAAKLGHGPSKLD